MSARTTSPRRARAAATLAGVVAAFAVLASCGDPAAPEDAPDGHVVVVDGVAHASGLQDPLTHCASCHGEDLTGGDGGEPSCFTCHGQKWR